MEGSVAGAGGGGRSTPVVTVGEGGGVGGSRYENQKRRDWNTFCQYLRNHRPPLSVGMCSGAHVLEFMRYLDQFGKTKVHGPSCPFFGVPSPPSPCPCPLRQAWGSLDSLVGRLRAAFDHHHNHPDHSSNPNPFASRPVRLYLREVRDFQAKSRGVSYDKKKRKRRPSPNHSHSHSHSHNHMHMHNPPPPF